MESIDVLALVKSHRTSNDKKLIRWDQENAKIEGRVKEYLAGSGGTLFLCLTIGSYF